MLNFKISNGFYKKKTTKVNFNEDNTSVTKGVTVYIASSINDMQVVLRI